MPRFLEIMHVLVGETDRYFHQYLDTLNEGLSPLPDVTLEEMYLCFWSQMGHDQTDRLKDDWSKPEQFYTAFTETK
jgi:hypothetical protein